MIYDTEPAFPAPMDDSHWYGLSMRDYFAAKAFQGMLANPKNEYAVEGATNVVAKLAYEAADDMIEARRKV